MTSTLNIHERPSPNKDARPKGRPVCHLILHYTGMLSAEEAINRLTDAEARVSAHYTVDEAGSITRHVDELERAWHAGVSSWCGETDINGTSVGIEVANCGHEFGYAAFPSRQITSVINLCKEVIRRHTIPPRNVIGHSDVAPIRKMDPGELFPWAELASNGVGLWPNKIQVVSAETLGPMSSTPKVRQLQRLLAAFGYGLNVNGMYDGTTQAVVTAFQRHFRQHQVDGLADAETQSLLTALLEMVDD